MESNLLALASNLDPSSENIYIVTCVDTCELENLYKKFEDKGIKIYAKRPLSLSTHCYLTGSQAEELLLDPLVESVDILPEALGIEAKPLGEPYTITGNFHKGSQNITPSQYQWGHLHTSGTEEQRRKGIWSSGSVYDSTTVFGDGRHVDVIIVDEPMSYDCGEWLSSNNGVSRFVQYQWFNELNDLVIGTATGSEGDSLPQGTIQYYSNSNNPYSHGNHVGGTACGKYYGWAKEANIYSLPVLGPMLSGQIILPSLAYDYIRAFHKRKPINPATGRKNPTVVNHSWGYSYARETLMFSLSVDYISQIKYNDTMYSKDNPNPSGWTLNGIKKDLGFHWEKNRIPAQVSNIFVNDVGAAVQEGIISIAAAGNENYFSAFTRREIGQWNNTSVGSMYIKRSSSWYNFDPVSQNYAYTYYTSSNTPASPRYAYPYRAGMSPSTDRGIISVGALSEASDFKRADFSNFGPEIDVFAPGEGILSCVSPTSVYSKIYDTKYGGNNYIASWRGTSMASPQVAGIAAIVAGMSSYPRYGFWEFKGYLQQNSIDGDMTFDKGDGSYSDPTCSKGSTNKYLHAVSPRELSGDIRMQIYYRDIYAQNRLIYPRRSLLMIARGVTI